MIAQQKQDAIGVKVSEYRLKFISGTAASKNFSDRCFDMIENGYIILRGTWEERGLSMRDRVDKFTRERDEVNNVLALNKCGCAMRGMSEKGSIPGGNCSVIKEKPIEGVDTLYLQLLVCK